MQSSKTDTGCQVRDNVNNVKNTQTQENAVIHIHKKKTIRIDGNPGRKQDGTIRTRHGRIIHKPDRLIL